MLCDMASDGRKCILPMDHDGDHVWEKRTHTDTERLNFLLRHFRVEDVGDDDVCLELRTSEEFRLPVAIHAKHVNGSMMSGWTCDPRQVIDAAIEREVKP